MSRPLYTYGSIEGTMLKTAAAMLPATIAISGYNIADTYFVSRLGTMPLAAMGFTFPVIMLIGCVNRGLGTGATTPMAHALGGGKRSKAARIAGVGVLIAVMWAVVIGVLGFCSIDWTFRRFGAEGEVLPLIFDYMSVWYLGGLVAAVSMTCNDILIASGRSKSASLIMLGGMGLNVVLDPIFIFGFGPFPAMGIRGAAVATVLAQGISAGLLWYLLYNKFRMVSLNIFQWRLIRNTWPVVMRVAIPAIVGMLMMPLGNGVITRVTAEFGDAAVAACAAAGRLEIIAFIVPMALGISLTPMVAQNFGAKRHDRIIRCCRFAMTFAFLFELIMGCVFFIGAPFISRFFSDNAVVIDLMTLYLRIIPWGFGMMEIHRYGGFFYIGCDRPKMAAWLNSLRIFFLLIPFSMLALFAHSLPGLFGARLAADVLSGIVCLWLMIRMIRKLPTNKTCSTDDANTESATPNA